MREIGTIYNSVVGRNLLIIRRTTARLSIFYNKIIKKFADRKKVRGLTLKKKSKVYLL